MSLSITALTWYWTALTLSILTYRLLMGWRRFNNIFLHRFTIFFVLLTAAFIVFGSTGFIADSFLIKLFVFTGHILMWAGFFVIAEIIWLLRLQNWLPKWIPMTAVLAGGGFELYLEWTCKQLPEIVKFGNLFTVTQFQLCPSVFFAEAGILWLFSIPMAIIFIQEALKLERKLKIRSLSIGLAFVIISVAGVLTIIHQPPAMLVIENIIISISAFALLIGAVIMPLSDESDLSSNTP